MTTNQSPKAGKPNPILRLFKQIKQLMGIVGKHHMGAYAAQASYYFVLSMIPIFLLLMTMVRYTNLTEDMVLTAILRVFPTSVEGLITSIIGQVYRQSLSIIPITVIVAIWAAGKGVMSITYGLNLVYEKTENRNYFYLRIRSSIFTVIFLAAIIISLVLSVFGNELATLVFTHIPALEGIVLKLLDVRSFLVVIVLTFFWAFIYRYLPNHATRIHFVNQIPGAFVTAAGWWGVSKIFSVYLDVFTGFSNMYGSMTTIILILLWLNLCMFLILIGGEVNAISKEFREGKRPPEDF